MRSSLIGSLLLGFVLILLTASTGNSDAVDPLDVQDNVAVPAAALSGENTVGQSFTFHSPRLHSIQVRSIVSDDLEYSPASRVILHLRRDVRERSDVATAAVDLKDLRTGDVKFDFPPLEHSRDRAYYFVLDASQAEITRGYISVWASAEDDYPDGQMYVNGNPADRDLAFRAYYSPDLPLALESLKRVLANEASGLLFVPFIFLVPGLACLLLFGKVDTDHPLETIGIAAGLSLSILSAGSFLLLWLGGSIQWLVLILVTCSILLLGAAPVFFVRTCVHPRRPPHKDLVTRGSQNLAAWAFAALSILSVAVAFIQIRDTPVPLWVDSPSHAEYVRGILAQDRFPVTGIYHLGYHSIVALLVQLTGLAIPQAMLLTGQMLVVLVGLSVFILSKRLSGSAIAALASAVSVWFLSPTPSYFITWGRYPLLMGAALLPMALFFAVEWIEQQNPDARTYALALVTCVGMAFAHIRLLAFYLTFVAVYWLARAWRAPTQPSPAPSFFRVASLTVVSLVSGMAWLGREGVNVGWLSILEKNAAAPSIELSTAVSVATWHHGAMVWGLAAIAAIVALFRHMRGALTVLTWFVALFGISIIPQGLIGGEYLPSSLVILMGFLPASVVIGELAHRVHVRVTAGSAAKQAVPITAVWIAAISTVSLLGASDMISIVNPATILFSSADEKAMRWITGHTPDDARFLINSFAWYGPSYAPSDGGSWIPYLTGRSVAILDSSSASASSDPEAMSHWIEERKITHIYLGRRAGILSKSFFACQPYRFDLLYDQDGIAIFRAGSAAAQGQVPALDPVECG